MSTLAIVLLVVLVLVLLGGAGPWYGEYRNHGLGLGGVLLVVVLILVILGKI